MSHTIFLRNGKTKQGTDEWLSDRSCTSGSYAYEPDNGLWYIAHPKYLMSKRCDYIWRVIPMSRVPKRIRLTALLLGL